MPRVRILEPFDYAAARVWLDDHAHTDVLPVDAHAHLSTGQWRALKNYVLEARHRGRHSVTGTRNAIDLAAVDDDTLMSECQRRGLAVPTTWWLRVVALKLAGLAVPLEADRRKSHLSGDTAQSLRLLEAEIMHVITPPGTE